MKLIFVTDLHGSKWKYERILKLAKERKVDGVLNSGDLLPKGASQAQQEEFISGYLNSYFEKFESAGIYYIYYPGNDDPARLDPLFKKINNKYSYIKDVAQNKIELDGFEFIGMNWVVDYPFRIKDRCRMDTSDYEFQEQYGKGVLSTETGWIELDDWLSYARTLPTIEDELKKLVKPENFSKSIYLLHMPPANLGLDNCSIGINIGSKAIYNFLKKNQPMFSVHGHIHESPQVSGNWYAKLGDSVCIQPGQMDDLTYVTIDLSTKEFRRFEEKNGKPTG